MARLHIRVQPSARHTKCAGWYGDVPKLTVAAPPVDGAANEAARAALAEMLGLRKRQIRLVGGAASRSKRFEVEGLTSDELSERLLQLNPRSG